MARVHVEGFGELGGAIEHVVASEFVDFCQHDEYRKGAHP